MEKHKERTHDEQERTLTEQEHRKCERIGSPMREGDERPREGAGSIGRGS